MNGGPAKTRVGVVKGLFRYPVKSMAGEALASAQLGWHGLDGDRRFAFAREDQPGGFPWLTATRVPSLITYRPCPLPDASNLPTHVETPAGTRLELRGEALRLEVAAAYGGPVRLMQLDRGTFDDAPLSLITTSTVDAIARAADRPPDPRRFRPNILVETEAEGFPEDEWEGRLLEFGDGAQAPAMSVSAKDVRCAMINLDPETAAADPEMLKATVRAHQTCAGVYGSTFRRGTVEVGWPVHLVDPW